MPEPGYPDAAGPMGRHLSMKLIVETPYMPAD